MQSEEAPYQRLEVYRKAHAAALVVHRVSLRFPAFEQHELASPLRRASKSIVANLVEGMGRQHSPAEVRRFVNMAMGSCDEVRIWLDFARDLGYLDAQEDGRMWAGFGEIGRMLRGVLNRYGAGKAARAS